MNVKFVSILGLLIGLFFAYTNYSSDVKYNRIDKNGLLAEAITPDTYTKHTRMGIKLYSLQLKFTTQEGREISAGTHNVSKGTIDKFEAGEVVMIKYLSNKPGEAIFVGDSVNGSVWYVWSAAFGTMMYGLLWLVCCGGIAYGLYGLFMKSKFAQSKDEAKYDEDDE